MIALYYYIRSSILTFVWLFVAIFLFMSLLSYSANDPSWSHASNVASDVSNLAGQIGAWVADILYTFLGGASWWLVAIACYEGLRAWFRHTEPHGALRTLGYVFLILSTGALFGLMAVDWLAQGVFGQVVAQGLRNLLTSVGAFVFLCVFLLVTFTFTFDLDWQKCLAKWSFGKWLQTDNAETTPSPKPKTPEQLTLSLSQSEQDEADASIIQPVVSKTTTKSANVPQNPLDDFLDETGFSQTKEFEWMDSNEGANPFKPISSAYLANSKLTKKLNAKLKGETFKENTQDPPSTADSTAVYQAKVDNVDNNINHHVNPVNHVATMDDIPTDEFHTDDLIFDNDYQPPHEHIAVANETLTANPTPVAQPDVFDELLFATKDLDKPNMTFDNDKSIKVEPIYQNPTQNHQAQKDTENDETQTYPSVAELLGMRRINITENQNTVDSKNTVDKQNFIHTSELTNVAEDDSFHFSLNENALVDDENVVVTPISVHERSVDSAEFDESNQTFNQNQNPLDIHNDALFANKSRAMQTAKYRADLPPLPPLDLLDLPDPDRKPSYTKEQLQQLSELLEIKLQDFNIKANVVNAQMGPVVTRFEVELAPGVKASKVTGIAKDLARSLSMASVRVVEVIPGKPYIGIEVPNPQRQMVRLIELLKTDIYQDPTAHLSMAMGKDIAGRPVVTDLGKAPHMLVAGTTGSGKSVLVNSLLLSLLLKYTPTELRLILIDPKQLELANYNEIPHLLTPVVTDMTEATSSLSWCVAEMERRYQLMSLFKVRKLDEFNKKIIESERQGHPLLDPLWRIHDSVSQDKPPKLKPLPQIVIVADEFADMIMQVGKQAEELITRLAQKSRAAGIHLILATQRPSVDVITGLIKANIPVRAALRVNSKVDSRTILDAGGAEDMLGHGDMLFLGPGQIEPNRVHGAFISDAEVNRICDAWRERGAPDYIDNMFDNFELSSPSGGDTGGSTSGDDDPLYDDVVAFVMESRKVSASSIQRKFSIGYNRAARIVDAMEEAGLVGPMKNGKRELLM